MLRVRKIKLTKLNDAKLILRGEQYEGRISTILFVDDTDLEKLRVWAKAGHLYMEMLDVPVLDSNPIPPMTPEEVRHFEEVSPTLEKIAEHFSAEPEVVQPPLAPEPIVDPEPPKTTKRKSRSKKRSE